jgi:hypothetical protein
MELAGLEPATSWVRCARRARITSICRAFGQHPPGSARPECPGIAGDYWEFAPENVASGANVGAESGSPAAYRGPGYLELIALVPAVPGVPASTARLRLPWRIPGSTAAAAPFPREAAVIVGAVVRCTRLVVGRAARRRHRTAIARTVIARPTSDRRTALGFSER